MTSVQRAIVHVCLNSEAFSNLSMFIRLQHHRESPSQYLMPWRNAFELGSHPIIEQEAIAVLADIASAFTMPYCSLRAIVQNSTLCHLHGLHNKAQLPRHAGCCKAVSKMFISPT